MRKPFVLALAVSVAASATVRGIFNQIPGQLAKKEKRYFLTAVNADARMREYAESFRWLEESKTVNVARNASDPDVALGMSADYVHPLYEGCDGKGRHRASSALHGAVSL